MQMLERLYNWYGKRIVLGVIVLIGILLVLGIVFARSGPQDVTTSEAVLRTVDVASVDALSENSAIVLVGTVEAVNEATIESEVSGRITSVPVTLGQNVRANAIIAQIENARERAAVLQAEGAYEAALAAAAQSDSSVGTAQTALVSARTDAVNAYRNSFTTTDTIIRSTIDVVFSNPESSIPGLRLNGFGKTSFIANERVAIETILDDWSKHVTAGVSADTVESDVQSALADVNRIFDFVEVLASVALDNKNNDNASLGNVSIDTFRINVTAARTNLNAVRENLEDALTSVKNAEDALTRAEIAGTNGSSPSSANAGVKQALGSLRAAEAALADTIIRTPISGTINSLPAKVGDFVGVRSVIAIVANNNALEITTYVGEQDRGRISVGDTVTIEGMYTGVISTIAPAVDPTTKKVEVKIQSETDLLANGDTVKITLTAENTSAADTRTFVPLTAVKFNAENGAVLTVEDGAVVSYPVTLGEIRGSSVEITSGIEQLSQIIVDARGVNAGEAVEPVAQ